MSINRRPPNSRMIPLAIGSGLAFLMVACADPITSVAIPAPGLDKAPTVTIDGLVLTPSTGSQGSVDKQNVSATSTVTIALDTDLMISGNANNPSGGVSKFSIKLLRDGTTMYNVLATGTPDSTNHVPSSLAILGTKGPSDPGTAGSSATIAFHMGQSPVTVVASATNFNNMTTAITVTYRLAPPPPPPPPPGPSITSFTASPNNGYINVGQSATLTWATANCGGCKVTMTAHDGPSYYDLLSSQPNLPVNGSLKVSPTRATLTKYTLTAKNTVGTASADVVVQLYGSAPACPQCAVYFFMMSSQTLQPTCLAIAIYAPDPATAAQLAQNQNGGYTAGNPVTYQTWANGCP